MLVVLNCTFYKSMAAADRHAISLAIERPGFHLPPRVTRTNC